MGDIADDMFWRAIDELLEEGEEEGEEEKASQLFIKKQALDKLGESKEETYDKR